MIRIDSKSFLSLGVAFLLFCGRAHAEDIETLKHEVYKSATVSRAEPDGIVMSYSGGIVKIPFSELPAEFKARFGYDEAKAKAFTAEVAQQQAELYSKIQADKADANARAAEIAAKSEAERAQKQAFMREKAAEEAQRAQRAASAKTAIQYGGIISGMTGEECIQASGKPQSVKRTTDALGNTSEQWFYGAGCIYFENGVVTKIENVVDGQDPRARP